MENKKTKPKPKEKNTKPKAEIKLSEDIEETIKPLITTSEVETVGNIKEEIKEELPAVRRSARAVKGSFNVESWEPKTSLGKKVKAKQITLDEVLDQGLKILEPGIIDCLIPNIDVDLLLIGQSKGKFGGGQRRVFKQTQKKTREGNKPSFSTIALIGNHNGYMGIGKGKSRETVPAREKAITQAKLNIIKIARGCGSWECNCKTPHSIPYAVTGKSGSVIVKLIPAPKGTGLVIEPELGKLIDFAGIKDVWSKTLGHSKTKSNAVYAAFNALRKLTKVKHSNKDEEVLGIVEGEIIEKNLESESEPESSQESESEPESSQESESEPESMQEESKVSETK